ncbi:membrane protein insertase YidC [Helicobacter muridarum]|uniref:Membrane protein insertase YidC n=1 Tax=Helicobacter muridarum TaxID=216 RepID=A0A099TXT4_9HELI|nr:membrane protein insertase YidC [Helicobacter muridarum]TLE01575.1 membrane protein insertase YidC [Helicobacter muridarum]STQ86184.1 Inner membrane protein translocase component YidC, long form [Helicobacter muridarum]
MDKQSNLRLILAVAISFLVIVVWSKFFAPESSTGTSIKQSNEVKVDNSSEIPKAITNQSSSQAKDTNDPLTDSIAVKNIITRVNSKDFDMDIDSRGTIVQVYLKADKYIQPHQEGIFTHIGRIFGVVGGENNKLDRLPLLANNASLYPLQMFFVDNHLRELSNSTPYTASVEHIAIEDRAQTLVLMQNLGDITVEKKLTIYPNMTYKVEINLSKPAQYIISNGMRPNADGESYAFHGVLLQKTDTGIEKIEDGDAKIEGQNYSDALYIASVDRYYTSLLFNIEKPLSVVVGSFGKGMPRPFVNLQEQNEILYGYIGPKDYNLLKSINLHLTSVVEYGRITFFAKYIFTLLDYLYQHIGNWGVAIILLTIIIRIILFPLSFKGMVSMQKLKDLAPKMKELQEKHKGNPQKLQASMMELYKKHGANPLGGCLPLLLQIPVFFAIYRVLYNAVELKNAAFFAWIHDLSVMDPYFILPLLMGLSMYAQQTLTPTAFSDPMQAKVFKWLPVIFTIFLITFPAGLILYWTVNNIISIIQQLAINKILDIKKQKEIEVKHKNKS